MQRSCALGITGELRGLPFALGLDETNCPRLPGTPFSS